MFHKLDVRELITLWERAIKSDMDILPLGDEVYVHPDHARDFIEHVTARVYHELENVLNTSRVPVALIFSPKDFETHVFELPEGFAVDVLRWADLLPEDYEQAPEETAEGVPAEDEQAPGEPEQAPEETGEGVHAEGEQAPGEPEQAPEVLTALDIVVHTMDGDMPIGEAFPSLTEEEAAKVWAWAEDNPGKALPSPHSKAMAKILE